MKMKTKQELIDEGFTYISKNQNDMEVWAKFTGWHDCVQFINFKEGVYIGDIQTTTYNQLQLNSLMFEILRDRQFFQKDIKMDTIWEGRKSY